jgi:hypothetical protein
MQLYAGTSVQFVDDTVQNRIGEKLRESIFHHFRYQPPASEFASWQNSLRAICIVLQHCGVPKLGRCHAARRSYSWTRPPSRSRRTTAPTVEPG